MELLCDVGCLESGFGLFGDSVSIDARWGAWFAANVP
jgi:hypothetical protein